MVSRSNTRTGFTGTGRTAPSVRSPRLTSDFPRRSFGFGGYKQSVSSFLRVFPVGADEAQAAAAAAKTTRRAVRGLRRRLARLERLLAHLGDAEATVRRRGGKTGDELNPSQVKPAAPVGM